MASLRTKRRKVPAPEIEKIAVENWCYPTWRCALGEEAKPKKAKFPERSCSKNMKILLKILKSSSFLSIPAKLFKEYLRFPCSMENFHLIYRRMLKGSMSNLLRAEDAHGAKYNGHTLALDCKIT